MYTRLAKGLLMVLNVLGVIAALIIAVGVGVASDSSGDGFLAFIGAVIVIGILLLFFGMFVELANNVMDIKLYLKKSNDLLENGDDSDVSIFCRSNDAEETVSQKTWLCRRCGVVNKEGEDICEGCGYHRNKQEKRPSLEEVAERFVKERTKKAVEENLYFGQGESQNSGEGPVSWFCSACGEKNRPQANFCASCGKKKDM